MEQLFHNDQIPNLFPYQIKDLDNFYNRDHPKNLHPQGRPYEKYWTEQLKRCVEGLWVNDNGTWIYMFPKLYFYINIGLLRDQDKRNKSWVTISPRLRDIEWIMFTYLFCCQGFSGFEGDDQITCNEYIKAIENGEELFDHQLEQISDACRKPNGTYKKYMDPWEYLTRHYLIDNKPDGPLGRPFYENQVRNFVVLSARGVGKTKSVSIGDLGHEFLTGGVKYWEDKDKIGSNTQLFFVGSPDRPRLQKLLNDVKNFYDRMPGAYGYGKERKPSPLYRTLKGSWKVEGADLRHEYETKFGEVKGSKSIIEKGVFTSERPHAGVGDRYARIYCDEFGLAHNALEIHAANKNSLMVGDSKTGMAVYTGTSGDIDRIQEPKRIFESPHVYDTFGIPNYWENPDKKIGLFIPAYYAYEELKDDQGNTKIAESVKWIMTLRKKIRDESSESSDLDFEMMYRPLKPSEMFMSVRANILPSALARVRLSHIELHDLYKLRATVGWFEDDLQSPYGVKFYPDLSKKLKPINSWMYDTKKVDIRGAVQIYEFPPEHIPNNLFKVTYDPVKDRGGGTSLAQVTVYKGFHLLSSEPDSLQDTIVAEWIGRYDELSKMHDIAIQMAKFFNAKVLPETNVPGFTNYCKMKRVYHLLARYPHLAVSSAINETPSKKNLVGFNMKHINLKMYCEQLLTEWLLTERDHEYDDEGKLISVKTTFDYIYSPRILDEIAHYDRDGNFDSISSLFGLMLWLSQEQQEPIKENEKDQRSNAIDNYFKTVMRPKKSYNPYYA